MNLSIPNHFPAEDLPPLIRNAVLDIHHNTQFPIPLIVSSALAAVSMACQNSINVSPPVGAVSPCSLFMLLIADSGEGKTPVDGFFKKPFIEFEENEARIKKEASIQQKTDRSVWKIECNAIEAAIKSNIKKCVTADIPDEVELLNNELEKLKQKWNDVLAKEPKIQRNIKLFYSNTTPIKLASDLAECWPSAGLFSDEAGSLFKGGAMKDLGMLNQLWDGATQTIDRKSYPSFIVKDARLTMSVMTQGKIFDNFINGRGKEARDIGFLARCLIAFPMSTKGTRFLNHIPHSLYHVPQSLYHLTVFQQRITDILTQDKLEVDQGRKDRRVLGFSVEAGNNWVNYRNSIEFDLSPGKYLYDIDDFASKISNNVARMAALFHFFEGNEGNISAESFYRANQICDWYINEFKRLFEKKPEIPLEMSDANELEQFLIRWCQNNPECKSIEKSRIAQIGPSQLRKSPSRRENALNTLAHHDRIQIHKYEKKLWVTFNPNVFPVPKEFESSAENRGNGALAK